MDSRSDKRAFVYGSFGLDLQEYEFKLTAPGASGRASAPRASEAERAGSPEGAAGGTVQGGSALGKDVLTTKLIHAPSTSAPDSGASPRSVTDPYEPSDTSENSRARRRKKVQHDAFAAVRRNVAEMNEGVKDGSKNFDGIHYCGRPDREHARVEYAVNPRTGAVLDAWVKGLKRCELAWLCPYCAVRQGYRHEEMIRKSIAGYGLLGSDAQIAFVTLTATHAKWRTLKEMITTVGGAFTELMRSRRMGGLMSSGLIYGWFRALEVTYNVGEPVTEEDTAADRRRKSRQVGWHPHLHILFLVKDYNAFMAEWSRPETGIPHLWRRALNTVSEKRGYKKIGCKPEVQRCQRAHADFKASDALSSYLTKGRSNWDIAKEVARGDLKKARKSSVTPQEMVLMSGNDARMAKLWKEYAMATKGVQVLTQSRIEVTKRKKDRGTGTYVESTDKVLVSDHLIEVYDEYCRRKANEEANLRSEEAEARLAAQQDEWDKLSDEEQKERLRLERELEQAKANDIPIIKTALHTNWDELRKWTAPGDFTVQMDELLHEVRRGGADAARAYAEEAGLPFVSSRRGQGGYVSSHTAEYREYKVLRDEFEERKREEIRARMAKKYPLASRANVEKWSEERLDSALSAFDERYRPVRPMTFKLPGDGSSEPVPVQGRNDGGASAAPRTPGRRPRRSRTSTEENEIYEEY